MKKIIKKRFRLFEGISSKIHKNSKNVHYRSQSCLAFRLTLNMFKIMLSIWRQIIKVTLNQCFLPQNIKYTSLYITFLYIYQFDYHPLFKKPHTLPYGLYFPSKLVLFYYNTFKSISTHHLVFGAKYATKNKSTFMMGFWGFWCRKIETTLLFLCLRNNKTFLKNYFQVAR